MNIPNIMIKVLASGLFLCFTVVVNLLLFIIFKNSILHFLNKFNIVKNYKKKEVITNILSLILCYMFLILGKPAILIVLKAISNI